MAKDEYTALRRNMVKYQLRERGIKDERVLSLMDEVPRHEFVPDELRDEAYRDYPLRIGSGQTISQPYMVGLMTELLELKGDEKVLEVGTGSGYQTAVLSGLCSKVVSVEIREELADKAKDVLFRLGYENVEVVIGDGSIGYRKDAPYDAIIVTAATDDVPNELLLQLRDDGILVIPVGGTSMQMLFRIKKARGKVISEAITPCVFVGLVKS